MRKMIKKLLNRTKKENIKRNEALELIEAKQFMDASEKITDLLNDEESGYDYYLLGYAYNQAKRWHLSYSSFESAQKLGYKKPELYKYFAISATEMKRTDQAIELWEKYLNYDKNPEFEILFAIGDLYRLKGNDIIANKYFTQAIKYKATPQIKNVWDLYIFMHMWDIAAEYLENEISNLIEPNANLLCELSRCYYFSFEYDKAEKRIKEAIELVPRPRHYARLVAIYEAKENYQGALDTYQKLDVENLPKRDEYIYRIAYCNYQLGNYKEACNYFEKYAAYCNLTDDNISQMKYVIEAKQAEAAEEYLAAFKLYQKAILALGKHSAILNIYAARCLVKLNKYEEACKCYKEQNVFEKHIGVSQGRMKNRVFQRNATFVECYDKYQIENDIVLYCSYNGQSFSGNPLAIYRKLKENPYLKHVIVLNTNVEIPLELYGNENVYIVRTDSFGHLSMLAKAKYIVVDSTLPFYFIPKAEQKILNTWHGTPLKYLGFDVKTNPYYSARNVSKSLNVATHIINPNQFTEDILVKSYTLDKTGMTNFKITGYPRQDLMINASSERKREIKRLLNIPEGKPVVLYAPTYRGANNVSDERNDEILSQAITDLNQSNNYHFLFKGHYFVKETDAMMNKIDTNELLSIVDVLISDYSSIAIDFLPQDKPIIYFTYDIAEYREERGLYVDIEEISDNVVDTVDKLMTRVEKLVDEPVIGPKQIAAKEKFCRLDDGNATDRVIEFFFNSREERIIDNRKDVLIYAGDIFRLNGITTAFTNLVDSFDCEKFKLTICVTEDLVNEREDTAILDYLYKKGHFISIKYYTDVHTILENWARDKYNKNLYFYNETHKLIFNRGVKRNARRMFGYKSFDVVINYESGYTGAMHALLANLQSPKKILVLHNDMLGESQLRFPSLRRTFPLYNQYDKIFTVSESVSKDNIKNIGEPYNIPLEKFSVMPNVINYEQIIANSELPLEVESDNQLFNGDKIFITIGRLSPEKNHELLIRSFAKLYNQSKNKNIKLLIMGGGPLELFTQNLINKLNMNGKIILLGLRSNPHNYLKKADCFVFPSLHEGQGLVLLESFVVGTPIITTDIPPSVEIVDSYGGVYSKPEIVEFTRLMTQFIEGSLQLDNTFDPQVYNDGIMETLYNEIEK